MGKLSRIINGVEIWLGFGVWVGWLFLFKIKTISNDGIVFRNRNGEKRRF